MVEELRQKIEEYINLTDKEFNYIQNYFTYKKYRKHQYLFQEGDFVKNNYFVLSGLVKAGHIDLEGKEHIVQFAMKGCWISDPQSYYHKTKTTMNVSCVEETEILFISLEDTEKLTAACKKMDLYFKEKAIADTIELQQRILSLISNNAKQRYQHFLEQKPGLLRRVPKAMIAAYLGVSRETLSRLRAF